eukprot:GHVQ01000743.1.p1 GENE.GHVQ01000743.1~~GHVQ01000743.1.p1  ORF type:complete len:551 (+),score=153.57 GHVQ01000743.1:541-2193(+)
MYHKASINTMSSTVYRPSTNSSIDESLFGTPPPHGGASSCRVSGGVRVGSGGGVGKGGGVCVRGGGVDKRSIMIVGKDTVQVRKMGGGREMEGQMKNSTVISSSELSRLKKNASLKSSEDYALIKQLAEKDCQEQLALCEARKEMRRNSIERRGELDEAEDSNSRAEIEQEQKAKRDQIIQRTRDCLDEQTDAVKQINQLMVYAKVATIRDAQIREKREMLIERERHEKELDQDMEIERQKALQQQRAADAKHSEAQRREAGIIVDQIKCRQVMRILEEEQREEERRVVLQQAEAVKAEEAEAQKQKHIAASKLMEEVNAANLNALKAKEERVKIDIAEDKRITDYMKAKDRREREREVEVQRQQAEKEVEVSRLRAKQEKAQDKAAEMDALRARRATQAAERTERDRERQLQAHSKRINQELNQVRYQQQEDKEKRLAELARNEQEEFNKIIQHQMSQEAAEREKAKTDRATRQKHAEEIRAQIDDRRLKSTEQRKQSMEEGKVIRERLAADKQRVETIKARKLQELLDCGIPDKYCVELAKKNLMTYQ